MLSKQVSKMLRLELLHAVTLHTFFGAGFHLFYRALIYHTYLSSLLSTILILSFKGRFFSGMENHVFLPIITAFCLPEQERMDLNCLETLMDFPCLSKPLCSSQQKHKPRPQFSNENRFINPQQFLAEEQLKLNPKPKCYR